MLPTSHCMVNSVAGRSAYGPVRPYGVIEATIRPGSSARSSSGSVPGNGHYAAAKAGVNVLTATLATELGPDIRVNAVAPGAVPTDIFYEVMKLTPDELPQYAKDTSVPLERLGTPEDIAAAVLYLASPASSWVTGEIITVSGGR